MAGNIPGGGCALSQVLGQKPVVTQNRATDGRGGPIYMNLPSADPLRSGMAGSCSITESVPPKQNLIREGLQFRLRAIPRLLPDHLNVDI